MKIKIKSEKGDGPRYKFNSERKLLKLKNHSPSKNDIGMDDKKKPTSKKKLNKKENSKIINGHSKKMKVKLKKFHLMETTKQSQPNIKKSKETSNESFESIKLNAKKKEVKNQKTKKLKKGDSIKKTQKKGFTFKLPLKFKLKEKNEKYSSLSKTSFKKSPKNGKDKVKNEKNNDNKKIKGKNDKKPTKKLPQKQKKIKTSKINKIFKSNENNKSQNSTCTTELSELSYFNSSTKDISKEIISNQGKRKTSPLTSTPLSKKRKYVRKLELSSNDEIEIKKNSNENKSIQENKEMLNLDDGPDIPLILKYIGLLPKSSLSSDNSNEQKQIEVKEKLENRRLTRATHTELKKGRKFHEILPKSKQEQFPKSKHQLTQSSEFQVNQTPSSNCANEMFTQGYLNISNENSTDSNFLNKMEKTESEFLLQRAGFLKIPTVIRRCSLVPHNIEKTPPKQDKPKDTEISPALMENVRCLMIYTNNSTPEQQLKKNSYGFENILKSNFNNNSLKNKLVCEKRDDFKLINSEDNILNTNKNGDRIKIRELSEPCLCLENSPEIGSEKILNETSVELENSFKSLIEKLKVINDTSSTFMIDSLQKSRQYFKQIYEEKDNTNIKKHQLETNLPLDNSSNNSKNNDIEIDIFNKLGNYNNFELTKGKKVNENCEKNMEKRTLGLCSPTSTHSENSLRITVNNVNSVKIVISNGH